MSSRTSQVLRNLSDRVAVAGCPGATDTEGRLRLDLVGLQDSMLAEACRCGLRWEVLSHEVEKEGQDAVLCIQAALNVPANTAMVMH